VAVELPESVRVAVAAATRTILADADARPVAEENLHVTIRFLGEVESGLLPALKDTLAGAASVVPASEAKVISFARHRWDLSPRVWGACVDDGPVKVLSALEREVTPRLAVLGIAAESRRFHPHVTVARSRRRGRRAPWRDEPNRCGPSASPPQDPVDLSFPVRELTLFESELTPRGPRYTALARFPLQPMSTKEQP